MPYAIYIFIVLLLMTRLATGSSDSLRRYNCSIHKKTVTSIGVVINGNTRVGNEIKTAMEVAVRDIYKDSCNQITLHVRDSSENSVQATSIASKLIRSKKVEVIIGTFSLAEAVFISELHKNFSGIPILLLTSTAMQPPLVPLPSNLIQFSHNFSTHMQCFAAIVGNFRWRRVTVISERSNLFPMDSSLLSVLSDSLRSVNAIVEQHIAFPPMFSLSDHEKTIEQELQKLKSGSNRVFLLQHISLKLATSVFQKATEMGMLEKGFVWIISDEIASLLDSVDSSVLASMQGVIGYRTINFNTSKPSYKEFKVKFKQIYVTKFPYDEGNLNPSLFALRAYDVIQAISKAKNAALKISDHSNDGLLFTNLLLSNFEGLSGNVSFIDGELGELPTFQIINIVAKSYMEAAFWSFEFGFSRRLLTQNIEAKTRNQQQSQDNKVVDIGPLYWPGGQQDVPRGWNLSSVGMKPLRIGVPASGAFRLVNVNTVAPNHTSITGFVIDVFKASLQHLPYDLPFEFVPYHGKYDDLLQQIHSKVFDAAVGDILILDKRYSWADFSQPYVQSGMNMIVTVKEDNTKEMWIFAIVFEKKMWALIISMGLFVGLVVWLVERRRNPEFAGGSVFQQFGTVFWFSFTLLLFVQKESPRSNLSKVVLVPWYFLVVMLTIYFTAALTSLMTASQLLPSVNDVEILKRENSVVGCDWNSFVCTYLADVMHFKPENIKQLRSVEDYPSAFEKGEIKAAFFATFHAKIFLTKHCKGYTLAGPTYTFGGFGFAFQKGSALSADMSQAIIRGVEKGEIDSLEQKMFARYKCSTSTTINGNNNSTTYIGPKPFSGLFCITGIIAVIVLLVSVFPSVEQQRQILGVFEQVIGSRIRARMSTILSRNKTRSRLPCLRPNSTPDQGSEI